MRLPLSLLLLALLAIGRLALAPSALADIVQQVSACVDINKSHAKDLETVKQTLLKNMQQQAPRVLYAKLYGDPNTHVSTNQFSVDYNDDVAKRLVMQGQPEYFNGDNFGELCVRAWYSLPEQQVVTVAAKTVSLKSFCYQEDGLNPQDLADKARMAAVERLIGNMAPGARAPEEYRRRLLEKAKVAGQLSPIDPTTYCLDIAVDLIPLELETFIPQLKTEAPAAPKPQPLSPVKPPDCSLDLSKYKEGDLAKEFGKNIAVYQDENGKSLGVNIRAGGVAVVPLKGAEAFGCSVLVKKAVAYEFKHSEIVELFTLHYKNQKYEPYAFKIALNDQGLPIAYFRSWKNATDYFTWSNATNFNDYHIVKKDKKINFFYNGKFIFTFPAQGDSPAFVRIPLNWDDRLYNVLIYNID
jgi:hypothetical protein